MEAFVSILVYERLRARRSFSAHAKDFEVLGWTPLNIEYYSNNLGSKPCFKFFCHFLWSVAGPMKLYSADEGVQAKEKLLSQRKVFSD